MTLDEHLSGPLLAHPDGDRLWLVRLGVRDEPVANLPMQGLGTELLEAHPDHLLDLAPGDAWCDRIAGELAASARALDAGTLAEVVHRARAERLWRSVSLRADAGGVVVRRQRELDSALSLQLVAGARNVALRLAPGAASELVGMLASGDVVGVRARFGVTSPRALAPVRLRELMTAAAAAGLEHVASLATPEMGVRCEPGELVHHEQGRFQHCLMACTPEQFQHWLSRW